MPMIFCNIAFTNEKEFCWSLIRHLAQVEVGVFPSMCEEALKYIEYSHSSSDQELVQSEPKYCAEK